MMTQYVRINWACCRNYDRKQGTIPTVTVNYMALPVYV